MATLYETLWFTKYEEATSQFVDPTATKNGSYLMFQTLEGSRIYRGKYKKLPTGDGDAIAYAVFDTEDGEVEVHYYTGAVMSGVCVVKCQELNLTDEFQELRLL